MKFILMRQVEAEPMKRGEHPEFQCWTIPANENPEDAGYLVTYPDGYVSWCPRAQFEAASRPCDGMTFGMAVEAMRRGAKVCRAGWNGKGMWIWLKPSATIKSEWCKDNMLKQAADGNGGEILGLGTICMYTHDSTGRKAVLTGWLASQSDMLSEDWMIVD